MFNFKTINMTAKTRDIIEDDEQEEVPKKRKM